MGDLIKIGRYEIVDAEFNPNNVQYVSIPCNTNPGLSYQLDGWDEDTSIPAWVDGRRIDLKLDHYDAKLNSWVLNRTA